MAPPSRSGREGPVFVTGEDAHSRDYSEDAQERAAAKALCIVPNTGLVDWSSSATWPKVERWALDVQRGEHDEQRTDGTREQGCGGGATGNG